LPRPFRRPLWSISVTDLLVTGTDTGIGKTFIAAALINTLRGRGIRALGFKPVESGVAAGDETDSDLLARASGESVALAAPVAQLREALAPAIAAERANVLVEVAEIERRVAALRALGFTLVVEGAGGVMVPLAWDGTSSGYTALDLAARCGLEAVVVARPGLGTLNHTTMTVEMLRQRHIPVRGIVLNRVPSAPDLAEMTNPAALSRLLPSILIIEVPDFSAGDRPDLAASSLAELIVEPTSPPVSRL
jgi:dethiobiotin synthetase